MAATRSALPSGYILADYKIERILGAGGFGITYLAKDAALKRLFAIKEYCPFELTKREGMTVHPLTDAKGDYERGLNDFIKEAQTLARYHHRNIVGVARIFEANNTAYMVLNFEEGHSLKEWLRERETRPDQQEMDAIAGPLLDALETIHADGTLHRDIAPDNIYIRKDGSPVLLDFGSARQAMTMRSRSVSAIVKAGYSPQEQYSSRAANQGAWTDIYALAATLYRALLGETPPEASDRTIEDTLTPLSSQKLKGYRPTFLSAIDWGLGLRPKDRPQSVAEWRGPLLHGKPTPSKPAVANQPSGKAQPARMSKVGMAAAIVFVVCSSVGATAFYFRDRIASLTASTEQAVQQSEATRKELEDAKAASSAELTRLQGEIEQSKVRSSSLAKELALAEQHAQDASSAEKQKYLGDIADLQKQIEQERQRASSLQVAERDGRDTLSVQISKLEQRLQAEQASKAKVAEEAEILRSQAFASSIEFAGLELGPANPDHSHNVRGVKLGSLFRGMINEAEVVKRISLNGEALDLADSTSLKTSEAKFAACDLLVAELNDAAAVRRVEVVVPSTFGPQPQTSDMVNVADLAIQVKEGRGSRPRISQLGSDSPFAKAGLQVDDEIVSIDGIPVSPMAEFLKTAELSLRKAGDQDVRYLRDCDKRQATVDFGDPTIEFDWSGLHFKGPSGGPPIVETIASETLFSKTAIASGDAFQQMVVGSRTLTLTTMAEAKELLAPLELCGTVKVLYKHGSASSVAMLPIEPAKLDKVMLADLGLEGWRLPANQGFLVDRFNLNHDGWDIALRSDDIVLKLGPVDGAAIAAMDSSAQQALKTRGGAVEIKRGCETLALNVPPYDPANKPVDFNSMSVAERTAIIKALYALGHYQSPVSSEGFINSGAVVFDVATAIEKFRKSRGDADTTTLAKRDVDYLLPLGVTSLPGDIEREIIGQILPASVAGNRELYGRRIDLFLKSNGYADVDRREGLARYLGDNNQPPNKGYISTLPVARKILSSTLSLSFDTPSTDVFGSWIYDYNQSLNRCEIFSRPTEVEGLLLDFDFSDTLNFNPRLYLGVDKDATGENLYMNFGGGPAYLPDSSVDAVSDLGKRFSMARQGDSFFPSGDGSGSSNELHKALKNGRWLDIVGKSRYGGALRLRYSAAGFADAFMRMSTECNAPKLADWLN